MRRTQSQNAQILAHLSAGRTLTIREAWDMYGIQSLTRRIADLRADGHDIETMKTVEQGMTVSAWRLRRDRAMNVEAPIAKGDKVRYVGESFAPLNLVTGQVGEVLHYDRRTAEAKVDIGSKALWIPIVELEKFIPLQPGQEVTVAIADADRLWVSSYSAQSDSYVVKGTGCEMLIPARFVNTKETICGAAA